jgi:serine/threonine-protein kinase
VSKVIETGGFSRLLFDHGKTSIEPVMIGQQILHYRIMEKLGEGGMGCVYRAEDVRLGRAVALKLLTPDSSGEFTASDHLHREAKLSSALNHANIATVYDLGLDGDHAFIVFEYIPGGTLRDIVRKRYAADDKLTPREVILYGSQIAAGLAHAHRHGVVHGDIKTDNVMLNEEGVAKITDFGVSTFIGDEGSPRPVGGTIAYMSPEQIGGESFDHRSDLFSLGVLLYELATGELPFRGSYAPAIEYAILNEEPTPIDSLRVGLPDALVSVIQRLLRKDPVERIQSSEEVASLLASVPEGDDSGTSGEAHGKDTSVTIAVLPLANRSEDSKNDYLVDGITEEIIWALTKVDGLRVVAPATSFTFKGTTSDISTIGAKLNVGTVLQGSVQSSRERLRIIVHLIDVQSGFDLWSERYDRQVDDLLEVQEEIARTIVETLRLQLVGSGSAGHPLVRPHTSDLDAYTLYLKGRFEQNLRTAEGLRNAADCFEKAVQIDSGYALGYTGLADTYALMSWYGGVSPVDAFPRAKIAAQRALAIDDSLAEAHASMALILQEHDWNWAASEREFRRAIELNRGYALAHHWYGLLLTRMGRFDEAGVELRQALELDPLSLTTNLGMGVYLYSSRQFDRAIEQLRHTLEFDRNYFPAIYFLGMASLQMGRFDESISLLLRAYELQKNLETLALLCHAFAVAGQKQRAEELLIELMLRSRDQYVSPYNISLIHTALGRIDEAIAWLEQGCRERSMRMLFLSVDPAFDPIRRDPRFRAMLKTIGLTG